MKLEELRNSIQVYEDILYKLPVKDDTCFIGNNYCMVSSNLLEDWKKVKLPSSKISLKDIFALRCKLTKLPLKESLLQRNVIGIAQALNTTVSIKGKTIFIKSGKKLAQDISIDNRFANLFKNHTFSYCRGQHTVFAINKETQQVEGILEIVTVLK